MTLTEAAALVIPSVVSGWIGMALRGMIASRNAQGVRLGEVERRLDVRDGWEAGYAKGYAAGAEKQDTQGIPRGAGE